MLICTAVSAERDAVLGGLCSCKDIESTSERAVPGLVLQRVTVARGQVIGDVLETGVGSVRAAVGAAVALTTASIAKEPYDLVISAGIAGGFPGTLPVGAVAVADEIVAADLGAESGDGFILLEDLGYGLSRYHPPRPLCRKVAEVLNAISGTVLTVSTITGSSSSAQDLSIRHPGVAAEAMEGFGVATAACAFNVPALEIRSAANIVGDRDHAAWRIDDALQKLSAAFERLASFLLSSANLLRHVSQAKTGIHVGMSKYDLPYQTRAMPGGFDETGARERVFLTFIKESAIMLGGQRPSVRIPIEYARAMSAARLVTLNLRSITPT